MNNRTLIVLTLLVIVGMLILLGLNLTPILTEQPDNQVYLKYNDVRGMAVSHNQLLYTLNFKQQNTVIDILNKAVPTDEIKSGKRQQPNIDKIVVYLFDNKPDLIISPIAYVDKNLFFTVPQWQQNGFLMELSEGRLQELLSQTYDP